MPKKPTIQLRSEMRKTSFAFEGANICALITDVIVCPPTTTTFALLKFH